MDAVTPLTVHSPLTPPVFTFIAKQWPTRPVAFDERLIDDLVPANRSNLPNIRKEQNLETSLKLTRVPRFIFFPRRVRGVKQCEEPKQLARGLSESYRGPPIGNEIWGIWSRHVVSERYQLSTREYSVGYYFLIG